MEGRGGKEIKKKEERQKKKEIDLAMKD